MPEHDNCVDYEKEPGSTGHCDLEDSRFIHFHFLCHGSSVCFCITYERHPVHIKVNERVYSISNIPWSLAPLKGKYYGTSIIDSLGNQVLKLWDHRNNCKPSLREIERFGTEFNEQAWAEYCCDSHYESTGDFELASILAEIANQDPPIQATSTCEPMHT